MTVIAAAATISTPFFLVDLAAVLPGVFILGPSGSILGGPDVLGDDTGDADILLEVTALNDARSDPRAPAAIITSVGLTISPTSQLLQAIAGTAFCNAPKAAAYVSLLTAGGTQIVLTLVYNGLTNVNVRYGTA